MSKGKFVKKIVPVTANNLTQAIIDFLTMEGHVAMRINTEGQFVEIAYGSPDYRQVSHNVQALKAFGYVVGRWRKSGSTKGVSDVLSCLRGGGFLAVEVKHGDDVMSKEQTEWMNQILMAGGLYYVCRKFEDFVQYYNQKIKPLL